MWYESILEKNVVPDALIRFVIRRFLKGRLQKETFSDMEENQAYIQSFIKQLKKQPIAVNTNEANEQHYEVPAMFFEHVLGPHLKYSCSYWNEEYSPHSYHKGLAKAEEDMLELTCRRANLEDGQEILELGCGWGSLSLYMAQQFPKSKITVVSNSASQKAYIDQQAKVRHLPNLTVITEDINDFSTDARFDRVVSIEMFEHMQNYELLMGKVASFLKPEGKLFIHIFCHKSTPYLFEVKDSSDWMAKYFFTGGMMPSAHLPLYFPRDFAIEQHWSVNGLHYHKTCEAWLQKMDQQKELIIPMFKETYGADQAQRWWVYWRIFFMSCSELFRYRNGNEWSVGHYLFSKRHLEE